MKQAGSPLSRLVRNARRYTAVVAVLGAAVNQQFPARADTTPLTILDPNLQVTVELDTGLSQPIGIVFLESNDYLVLEKASGQIKRVINRVIQKHYNEIKYCYEKELTRNPALYGKVTVLFLIDGAGRIGDALVQQSTMSSEPVESCMINRVRRWVFPAPQGGGTVQVTYPYVFKSSGQ